MTFFASEPAGLGVLVVWFRLAPHALASSLRRGSHETGTCCCALRAGKKTRRARRAAGESSRPCSEMLGGCLGESAGSCAQARPAWTLKTVCMRHACDMRRSAAGILDAATASDVIGGVWRMPGVECGQLCSSTAGLDADQVMRRGAVSRVEAVARATTCLLYTSPSPRD